MNYKKIIATISKERNVMFATVKKLPRSLYATIDFDENIVEIYSVAGTFVSLVDCISTSNRMNLIYHCGALKFSSFRTLLYKSKKICIKASCRKEWSLYDYE